MKKSVNTCHNADAELRCHLRALTSMDRLFYESEIKQGVDITALREKIAEEILSRARNLRETSHRVGKMHSSVRRIDRARKVGNSEKILTASLALIKQYNRQVKNHMKPYS